jgi:hypothetical protein
MKLYRCNCNLLSPKKNNLRKAFVSIAKNGIKNNLKKNLELRLIFIDSGGLLDEYKIIKKSLNKRKYKNIELEIILLESIEKNEILLAQKYFIKQIKKKFNNIKIDIKNYTNFSLENLKNNGTKNIFIGIDVLPETYSYFEKIINFPTQQNFDFELYFLYSFIDQNNIEKCEILKIKN